MLLYLPATASPTHRYAWDTKYIAKNITTVLPVLLDVFLELIINVMKLRVGKYAPMAM